MKDFKQQLNDLLEKEGLKCTIEETDEGLLVVEKKGRFRAEHGKIYWYVTDGGYVANDKEQFTKIDNYRHSIYNYFETRKQAEELLQNQVKLGKLMDEFIFHEFLK
jgi:hypothetical protein